MRTIAMVVMGEFTRCWGSRGGHVERFVNRLQQQTRPMRCGNTCDLHAGDTDRARSPSLLTLHVLPPWSNNRAHGRT